MSEKEEVTKDISPEERAKLWEQLVRQEINDYLDVFLPEAITGNIGVLYDRPILGIDPKTGQKTIDEKHAKGVRIVLDFVFAEPIEFFDKKPE